MLKSSWPFFRAAAVAVADSFDWLASAAICELQLASSLSSLTITVFPAFLTSMTMRVFSASSCLRLSEATGLVLMVTVWPWIATMTSTGTVTTTTTVVTITDTRRVLTKVRSEVII